MLALFLCRTSFTDTKCNSAKSNNLFRLQKISVLSKKKKSWFSFYQESCSPCIHLYNLYVDLVSRDQVLYLNLRIMTPFCASYFYVYLTWEPGEGLADTLGNIVSSALSFLLLSVSFSFHCFASLLQREEGGASSV